MSRVAIIGGGLAGTACAYVMKRAGLSPVIYEAGSSLGSGASGNLTGLYNPRLAAHFTPESQFYAYAFERALEVFAELEGVSWNPCGALHLITDEKREKRYQQMAESWPWADDMMRLVSAGEASEIAGVGVSHDALYLPKSGGVSPRKLCESYADGFEVMFNSPVQDLEKIEADFYVLASGPALMNFDKTTYIPLQTIRGQITFVRVQYDTDRPKCAICYGGYMAPSENQGYVVGSTFQRWLDHDEILLEDDGENIKKLSNILPGFASAVEVYDHSAALRVAAKDQCPVIGKIDDKTYVSTGHGSHGILSSLAAAEILTAQITGSDLPVSDEVLAKIDPARFGAG